MKISEITVNDLIEYAREDETNEEIINTFTTILSSIKAYIKNYTGLTDEQIDDKEDITMVIFVLSNEMYENRLFTVNENNVNKVISNILDMHSINLL